MEILKRKLEEKISSFPGDVGLAVTDLQTGETISIDGDKKYQPGSVIKIFTWLSVLKDIEEGEYALDEVEEQVDAMLYWSDNPANTTLTEKTGIETINERMRKWGMERSVYSGWEDVHYSKAERWNYLVPEEVNLVLTKLYGNELFSEEYTDLAIEKLTHSVSYECCNYMIPKYLPKDGSVVIANKFGWYPEVLHADAGIVMMKRGAREIAYIISFFCNSSRPDGGELGAELSKMVFDHFDREY